MRYYEIYNENGKRIAIGKGDNMGTEIAEAEYNAILTEIREKANLVNQLYSGEITIDDAPEEWREEIQRRVDERIAREAEYEPSEIELKAQAYDIITGVAE